MFGEVRVTGTSLSRSSGATGARRLVRQQVHTAMVLCTTPVNRNRNPDPSHSITADAMSGSGNGADPEDEQEASADLDEFFRFGVVVGMRDANAIDRERGSTKEKVSNVDDQDRQVGC